MIWHIALKADWVELDCGHYNTETKSCTGQSSAQ